MRTSSTLGRRRAILRFVRGAGAATLVVATACHVWKPAQLDTTREFLNGRTRLERTDGTTLIIRGPRLVGDSIVGTHANTAARVALARGDVKRIEVQRVSRGRTALVGAVLVVLYMAANVGLADEANTSSYSR